jgi:hypothetical protein
MLKCTAVDKGGWVGLEFCNEADKAVQDCFVLRGAASKKVNRYSSSATE